MKLNKLIILGTLMFSMAFVGCAHMVPVPEPDQVTIPTPIAGNSGEFMSPYKADGSLTEWADNWVKARVGASVGTKAGAALMGGVPFFGDTLARKTGAAFAMKIVGGEEFMKKTSDLSFNNLDNLIVYIYAKHSTEASYSRAFEVVSEIYTDVKIRKSRALINAKKV